MKWCSIILVLMLFMSCHSDITDVTILGTIRDSESKKPISDVDITVICWKYRSSPDASYTDKEIIITKTDSMGEYKVVFDKAAFIMVKASFENYIEGIDSREVFNKKNGFDILLKKK